MEYGLIIGVIAFLVATGLYGYKKGMIKILLSMIALVIAVVLATALSGKVADIVKDNTHIYSGIYEKVYDTIKENNVVDISSLSNIDVPKQIKDQIDKGIEKGDKVIADFEIYAATEITNTIFNAGVYLVLVVLLYVVILVVIHVFDFVAKLPVINEVNKLGGFAIGLLYGLVVLWIACLVVTACANQEWAKAVFEQINDNAILGFIYNNNLITWIVTTIL